MVELGNKIRKEVIKMKKDFFKKRKEILMNGFFGANNYNDGNNRFNIKNHVINDDEIIICTNNVSYWRNKDQFILWVGNGKIVYLNKFQVLPVFNYEEVGSCYLVKLNKNYYKVYNCFVNEELSFDKELTFQDLKDIAIQQDTSNLWFKFEEDKYGNRVF